MTTTTDTPSQSQPSSQSERQRADLAEQLSVETLELLKTSLEAVTPGASGPLAEVIATINAQATAIRALVEAIRAHVEPTPLEVAVCALADDHRARRVAELEGRVAELEAERDAFRAALEISSLRALVDSPTESPEPMIRVLVDLTKERVRQNAKWGEQNHPDLSVDLPPNRLELVHTEMGVPMAHVARDRVERLAKRGTLGYADIALEEFAEAIEAAALGVTTELRRELVQTAAVLVAWIECIDRRAARRSRRVFGGVTP